MIKFESVLEIGGESSILKVAFVQLKGAEYDEQGLRLNNFIVV